MEVIDFKDKVEAESAIADIVSMYSTPLALRSAIELGIPDIISSSDTPVTNSELVSQLALLPAKSVPLSRLMRVLVRHGMFAIQKDDHGQEGYVSTYMSKALSTKSQGSIAAMVLFMTDPMVLTTCLSLADWFHSTAPSPFEGLKGMNLYEYFGMNPDRSAEFNAAMASSSEFAIKGVLKDLKPLLEGFDTLVDVGGGTGMVAKAIAEAAPHLKCTVVDLEHVVSSVKDTNGITFVVGNMFEFVPSADIIHMKSVLCDWGDEHCLKILRSCREAISRNGHSGGKLIVVDCVVDANETNSESLRSQSRLDFFTLCVVSENAARTEMQWKELFMAAGFTSYKITPAFRFNSIIEVYP